MEVLKLLQTMGPDAALQYLEDELCIKVRREVDEDGLELAALNYDQIESPKFDPVVQECRGLVIDPNVGVIVSRAFNRFFNHGEGGDNENFKIDRAAIMEKVDGSLIKLYFYGGKWIVSTRGTCFGNAPVGPFDMTFRELFMRAIGIHDDEDWEKFTSQFHKNLTYIFEVACIENRIVTRYENDQAVLLGARSPTSGHYKGLEYMERLVERLAEFPFNVRLPRRFNAGSFDEVLKATSELEGLEEGFVAWDMVSDERVKFKSAAYVAVHHLRGEGAPVPKRVVALILENEDEEYLTYFGEDREYFEPYKNAFYHLLEEMEQAYEEIKDIEDQKQFAMEALKTSFSGALFTARKHQCSTEEAFRSQNTKKQIEQVIQKKEEMYYEE